MKWQCESFGIAPAVSGLHNDCNWLTGFLESVYNIFRRPMYVDNREGCQRFAKKEGRNSARQGLIQGVSL